MGSSASMLPGHGLKPVTRHDHVDDPLTHEEKRKLTRSATGGEVVACLGHGVRVEVRVMALIC